MIVVTGGAGFIGSNLVRALNGRGRDDVLVVDDLTAGGKFVNLADRDLMDYWDKEAFLAHVTEGRPFAERVEAVFHLGACSATTEWDGRYLMRNNFEYSKRVLHYCVDWEIPFIYASSAAVYGASKGFAPVPDHELPLNVYGYSKLLFDRYVRRALGAARSQVAGLRYFNVYGPGESHKGGMASVAYQFYHQLRRDGQLRLFEGSGGYEKGEQRRDFIHVDDAVTVSLWFLDHPERSGVFNVGTGRSQSFNELARAVLACFGSGEIQYIAFPDKLRDCYQSFTQADISELREAGYRARFRPVQEGVAQYMHWLEGNVTREA